MIKKIKILSRCINDTLKPLKLLILLESGVTI